MSMLDRKLYRGLGRMWAQTLAIALVMACGVATLILAMGAYRSLEETRSTFYDRYRFATVFASLVRAPMSLRDRIAAIDGISGVELRIVKYRHSRHAGHGGAGDRHGDLDPRPWRPRGQPGLSALRPAAGAGARRRGRGHRDLRGRAPHDAGQHLRGGDERAEAHADGDRHRAVARICLRHRPRRHGARQPPFRRLLHDAHAARRPVRHGRRLQRRGAEDPTRRQHAGGHRPSGRDPETLWRHRRTRPRHADLQRLPRQRADRIAGDGGGHSADLPVRLGLPGQHDPVAADLAGARADRADQGRRLF